MSDDQKEKSPEQIEFNGWHPADFHVQVGQATDYGRCYRIGIFAFRPNGDYYAADNIKLDKIGSDGKMNREFIPDALKLNENQAQELMDSLWDAGIRPNQAKLKKLQVGALENHLSDLQNLTFSELLPLIKMLISDKVEEITSLSEELEEITKPPKDE